MNRHTPFAPPLLAPSILAASILALTLAFAPIAAQAQALEAAPTSEAAVPLTEADIEAEAETFETAIEAMTQEMQTAISEAGGAVAAKSRLDAIQAKYQPNADTFADKLSRFIDAQLALAPEEARAGMQAAKSAIGTVRSVPAMVRQEIETAASAAGD